MVETLLALLSVLLVAVKAMWRAACEPGRRPRRQIPPLQNCPVTGAGGTP